MKHYTIINFITTIRESSPINNIMYRQGDCYKFHLILKSFLGNECIPKILTSMHHVISLYQGRLYDITGECDYLPSIYRDLTDEDMEFVQHWDFAKLFTLNEHCIYCGEKYEEF